MAVHFTPEEEGTIRKALVSGEPAPPCPRCGTALQRREVPPRPEVAYVRDRIWLTCSPCGRSLLLDRRELREDGGRTP